MARMLLFILTFGLLVGVLPIFSTHVTMQMDEVGMSQHDNRTDENKEGDRSPTPCCNELVHTFTGCVFLVPQYSSADLSGGNERVESPIPLFQSTFAQAVAPPPKA